MKEYLENYEEVLKAQNSSDQGLSTGEAEKRLAQYGKNKLKEAKKDSILKRFLKELSDPMILILIAAAIISGITAFYQGESFADVIIIIAVVIINAVLGVVQEGKAEAALKALLQDGMDFAYVHLEAPDEMGHQGSTDDKIKAIELIDDLVIGPVAEGLEQAGEDYRMLILPDHPTPVRVRTHTGDPVPYMLYDSTNAVKGQDEYSERTAQKTGIFREKGDRLIDHLLERE